MGIFYTLNVFIMQFYLGAPLQATKAAGCRVGPQTLKPKLRPSSSGMGPTIRCPHDSSQGFAGRLPAHRPTNIPTLHV